MNKIEISTDDGKYHTVFDNGKMTVNRHGKPWRDTTGDGYILSLVQRIDQLQVVWHEPSEPPQLERGQDVKVWGVVDIHYYDYSYDHSGKSYKIVSTLRETVRKVVELRFSNTVATDEESAYYEENGEFPERAPAWLDDWLTEDGDFIGMNCFYRRDVEEGGFYYNEFHPDEKGKLITVDNYNNTTMELIAWSEFIIPEVPNVEDNLFNRS